MDATFRYDLIDVRDLVLKEHERLWPAPTGFKWECRPDGYGSRAVEVELVKVEEQPEEGKP